jgi:Holliday junction resolvase RusA-like endonuclease
LITFEVPGKPRGKGRPRFSMKTGHAYTPKDTASYENLVKVMYLNAGGELHEGPVHIYIDAYYQIPVSKSKKEKALMEKGELMPTVLPDADNIIKSVLDGLNNVAF